MGCSAPYKTVGSTQKKNQMGRFMSTPKEVDGGLKDST